MKIHNFVAVVALVACAHARTATRTPAVTAQITSLSDKDARQKASVHPAFANAGKQAGVEVWRIKNFNPEPVSQKDFGKFHKGDSYIVLKTTSDKRNNLSWNIHYWIGSESTQDESGAAAILSVGLDDKFNGAAVQHREVMGQESQMFLGYFSPSIKYLDGGHATGFKHVTTNAGAKKKLFQVKGKKNVRVRQMDPLISSMNKGDVFILDIDQDILVYVGEKARNVEKLKAVSFANQIRDQDHNGRGKVEILDQYTSEVDIDKFFTLLGSGAKNLVPEDSAGGDDQAFEKSEEQKVTLSEVSDRSGSLKVVPLAKPLKQEQLNPQESYILETVSGSIYVWIGKQSSAREKSEVVSKAQQLLTSKNYPAWVQVVKIPQGTEPAIFKQYFATWRDIGMAHSRIVRSAEIEAKLFEIDVSRNNEINFRGMKEFNQAVKRSPFRFEKKTHIQPDSLYLLETDKAIYIWLGSDIDQRYKKLTQTVGQSYTHNNYNGLENKMTHIVKQGREPDNFQRQFTKWDPDMWNKQRSYEMAREEVLRLNEI